MRLDFCSLIISFIKLFLFSSVYFYRPDGLNFYFLQAIRQEEIRKERVKLRREKLAAKKKLMKEMGVDGPVVLDEEVVQYCNDLNSAYISSLISIIKHSS